MTIIEAHNKASAIGNLPENIHPKDKERYIKLWSEIFFNKHHKINAGYVEYCRNEAHRIIADCLYTKGKKDAQDRN